MRLGQDIYRKTAKLGYWLGEPSWGRGIMSEAVKAFTRFAFETFDLQRIFVEPFENNSAAARVLEKAGFTREGLMRSSIFKDGKVLNSFLYAKIGNVGLVVSERDACPKKLGIIHFSSPGFRPGRVFL